MVAITGYGREEDRERSRAAGFDQHLVKPVDLDALHALLAEVGKAGSPRERTLPGKCSDSLDGVRTASSD